MRPIAKTTNTPSRHNPSIVSQTTRTTKTISWRNLVLDQMNDYSKFHLHPRYSLSPSSIVTLLLVLIITIIYRPSTVTALSLRETIDWAIHGIGAEVFHNTVVRPLSSVFGSNIYHNPPISSTTEEERSIAIVTGVTGGIDTELCRGLLSRNYHVMVNAFIIMGWLMVCW